MKRAENKKKYNWLYLPLVTAVIACMCNACKKESKATDQIPPKITSISYLQDRQIDLQSANYGEWILIKGDNLAPVGTVDFNGVKAADSLIYADKNTITVKIPTDLPDPVNNPITVSTPFGTVTHQFKILQPAPLFDTFMPVWGGSGDAITLLGDYFVGVEGVFFGALQAEIVEKDKNKIVVKVPQGAPVDKIKIVTPSGVVVSEKTFGFKYLLFAEAIASGWWSGPWGGTTAVVNEEARTGSLAIKFTAAGTWGGAKYGKNAPDVDAAGFTGIKFSLFGLEGTSGKKVKVYLNGVSGKGYEVFLKEGTWQDFEIPLYNLGSPNTINTVTLQEFSGNPSNFYIDDIGFY
ncbi:hypothetical protein [Sphingobacterium faecale]|uniref:IPT/TIG domain-containing protein n=1 Tax=Sphingobacterium faecale TaxID=2803775 RepID=A0ABS1R3A7_9SPHI|nr:hypothetical protein [Sphingobacterium faecale]MBL1409191.1 hypothetical protein [Sphingobacterium faecale]